MYKNLLFVIFITSLILIILLFFYNVNIYTIGSKYIEGNKTYLIFNDVSFIKKIVLINNQTEINIYIKNIYYVDDLKIYEINGNVDNIEKIIAIKEKVSLIKFLLLNF